MTNTENQAANDTLRELHRLKLATVLVEGQVWELSKEHHDSPSPEWRGMRPPPLLVIKSIQLESRAVICDGWDGPVDPDFFVRGVYSIQKPADGDIHVAYRRLPALTIHQPWAWAIMEGLKDVENRKWQTPKKVLGSWMWIHASRDVVRQAVMEVRTKGINMPEPHTLPTMAVLGAVQVVKCVDRHPSPWFTGPFAWVMRYPIKLPEPIHMPGKQGLWVPDFTQQEV